MGEVVNLEATSYGSMEDALHGEALQTEVQQFEAALQPLEAAHWARQPRLGEAITLMLLLPDGRRVKFETFEFERIGLAKRQACVQVGANSRAAAMCHIWEFCGEPLSDRSMFKQCGLVDEALVDVLFATADEVNQAERSALN